MDGTSVHGSGVPRTEMSYGISIVFLATVASVLHRLRRVVLLNSTRWVDETFRKMTAVDLGHRLWKV